MESPQARRLPAESIFVKNHMGYVMSSPDTLRAYLVEALGIDAQFIDKFSVHDCISTLDAVLRSKPEHATTEAYLLTQRLWILHKLLMTIPGCRERIQQLLQPREVAEQHMAMRQAFIRSLVQMSQRASQTLIPVFIMADESIAMIANMKQHYQAQLAMESAAHVERRCRVIRWFAWLICGGYHQWMLTVPINDLYNALDDWQQPSEPVRPTFSSTTGPLGERTPLRPDSPTFIMPSISEMSNLDLSIK